MFKFIPYRWVAAVVLICAPSARSDDLYFMTIYGAQKKVNDPRYAHTWGTFVHLQGNGPSFENYQASTFSISWGPERMEIKPLKIGREKGYLFSHEETVSWCKKHDVEIRQFGPYQIKPELHAKMVRRYDYLARGKVRYHAVDLIHSHLIPEVVNCVYAVGDFDFEDSHDNLNLLTLGYGYKASAMLARNLKSWMLQPENTHPWATERVGIETYPSKWPTLLKPLEPREFRNNSR